MAFIKKTLEPKTINVYISFEFWNGFFYQLKFLTGLISRLFSLVFIKKSEPVRCLFLCSSDIVSRFFFTTSYLLFNNSSSRRITKRAFKGLTAFLDGERQSCKVIPLTVLKNRKSLKKKCLGLWLVWSENSHFPVSEILCPKTFSIWLFEKINFKVWNVFKLYFSFKRTFTSQNCL